MNLRLKFRVRVRHFASDRYAVEYAHYRLIPNWRALMFWFDQGHPGGTECFSTWLGDHKEAEATASKIKSIEDVKKWNRLLSLERHKWQVANGQFMRANMPYTKKEIAQLRGR